MEWQSPSPVTGVWVYDFKRTSETSYEISGSDIAEGNVLEFEKQADPRASPFGSLPATQPGTQETEAQETQQQTTQSPSLGGLPGTQPDNAQPNPAQSNTAQPAQPQAQTTQVADDNAWFIGKWRAVANNHEFVLENRPDGTYQLNSDYYAESGTWTLNGETLTQNHYDQNTGGQTSNLYTVQKVADTDFIQTPGYVDNARLFYTKIGEAAATAPAQGHPDNPSWIVGTWWTLSNLDTFTYTLNADGTYLVTIATTPYGSYEEEIRTYQGTWKLKDNVLSLTGDLTTNYVVTAQNQYLYIAGGGFDAGYEGLGEMFMRADEVQ